LFDDYAVVLSCPGDMRNFPARYRWTTACSKREDSGTKPKTPFFARPEDAGTQVKSDAGAGYPGK